MRKGVTAVVIGAVLGLGAFAAAQAPPYTVRGDRHIVSVTFGADPPAGTRTSSTFIGNVVLQVNGITVHADRAVIKDGEVTFEGNVRMTLPEPK